MAFNNEYDFDSPDAIDFDMLVDRLQDLKTGWVREHVHHGGPFT